MGPLRLRAGHRPAGTHSVADPVSLASAQRRFLADPVAHANREPDADNHAALLTDHDHDAVADAITKSYCHIKCDADAHANPQRDGDADTDP